MDSFFMDWEANSGNTRGRILLLLFRIAQSVNKGRVLKFFGYPIVLFYNFFVRYILSVDLPLGVSVGKDCQIFHGFGLVVHDKVIIGDRCVLRHSVTIGVRNSESSAVPVLGDDVEIGCGAILIGGIKIGNGVKVGAGSVVLDSIPDYSVVYPNKSIIK